MNGDTAKIVAIQGDGDAQNTNADNFSAMAIMNTDKGTLLCNAGFSKNISFQGNAVQTWYLDETNRDVLIPKAFFGAEEIGESFADQWLRYNFIFK